MKKIINFPTKKILDSHQYYKKYVNIKDQLLNKINKNELKNIIEEILTAVKRQKNIFSCGNGGSASTAEHLSCDFSKGSCTDTNLNIKVFSLNSNVSLMTAIANDISYDDIFSYQLARFGKPNDILFLFSVSGSSRNILKCAKEAKRKKLKLFLLLDLMVVKLKNYQNITLILQQIILVLLKTVIYQSCILFPNILETSILKVVKKLLMSIFN